MALSFYGTRYARTPELDRSMNLTVQTLLLAYRKVQYDAPPALARLMWQTPTAVRARGEGDRARAPVRFARTASGTAFGPCMSSLCALAFR